MKAFHATVQRWLGIRARLMLLVALIVVPLGVDRVIAIDAARRERLDAARIDLVEFAANTVIQQRRNFASVEAFLETLSRVHVAMLRNGENCAMLFAALPLENTGIRGLSVVDTEGRVQCATAAEQATGITPDMALLRDAVTAGRFQIGDAPGWSPDREPRILAAWPILARKGKVTGAVMASLDVNLLAGVTAQADDRGNVIAMVTDSRGVVLAATRNAAHLVHAPLPDETRGAVLAQDFGTINSAMVDGHARILVHQRIPGSGLHLVAGMDENAVLEPINHEMLLAVAKFVAIGLMTLCAAWFMIERLVMRPILDLAATAAAIGRDDAGAAQPGMNWAREFAPLATAFRDLQLRLTERERDLRRANSRLAVQASMDNLSGLANRRGFNSRLEFEWLRGAQTGASLGLLMIDIDHFKQFNDRYGHLAGDDCLRRVGAVLKRYAALGQGFAARFGGEEFLMLLPGLDDEETLAAGEDIRRAIEELGIAHSWSARGRITVSVGAAAMIPTGEDARKIIGAADAGLYAAKDRGRNQVVLHAAIPAEDSATACIA